MNAAPAALEYNFLVQICKICLFHKICVHVHEKSSFICRQFHKPVPALRSTHGFCGPMKCVTFAKNSMSISLYLRLLFYVIPHSINLDWTDRDGLRFDEATKKEEKKTSSKD